MNRLSGRSIIAILVFVSAVLTVVYWLYPEEPPQKPDIVSISRFDFVFAKDLKLATETAGMPDLREVRTEGDDLEVRVWRAYSLPTLEGVFLRRNDGNWSGLHLRLRSDEQGAIQGAEVEQLKLPASGWDTLWGELVGKGILLLPLTPENECDTKYIDGIRYIVEIGQGQTYRNYQLSENLFDCRESKQMTEIGEIIGIAFDSGQEKCTYYEWFACMKERKAQSLDALK